VQANKCETPTSSIPFSQLACTNELIHDQAGALTWNAFAKLSKYSIIQPVPVHHAERRWVAAAEAVRDDNSPVACSLSLLQSYEHCHRMRLRGRA